MSVQNDHPESPGIWLKNHMVYIKGGRYPITLYLPKRVYYASRKISAIYGSAYIMSATVYLYDIGFYCSGFLILVIF